MRVTGVIAEYNPFHNGHALHLKMAREVSDCDYIIVAMSGGFTQRGEPALLDKWTRARMALLCGADMVLELPALFAVRSADWFARGGVELLSAVGADCLSFGCEAAALGALADMPLSETEEMRSALKAALAAGQSHAKARGAALAAAGVPSEALDLPNASLALEYARANANTARPMELFPVAREVDYRDARLAEIASATAVRDCVFRGESPARAMPEAAFRLLDGARGSLASPASLDAPLIYALRALGADGIARLPDVREGLQNRVAAAADVAGTREALLKAVKCKRYTYSRLSRLCAHALLGLTDELARGYASPPYARVLGFRRGALPLVREIARRARVPLVTEAVKLRGDAVFALDARATDLRALCARDQETRRAGRDYSSRLITEDS